MSVQERRVNFSTRTVAHAHAQVRSSQGFFFVLLPFAGLCCSCASSSNHLRLACHLLHWQKWWHSAPAMLAAETCHYLAAQSKSFLQRRFRQNMNRALFPSSLPCICSAHGSRRCSCSHIFLLSMCPHFIWAYLLQFQKSPISSLPFHNLSTTRPVFKLRAPRCWRLRANLSQG